jgi:hypothetical protein
VKVFFRQLTVVKIDASFSYIVCFDETFKFTAREDEVSLGVYWFFRRNGMESGLPLAAAAAAMQLHVPLLILLPCITADFRTASSVSVRLKNNKPLWHFPQHRSCVDFLSGLTNSSSVQTSFVFPQNKRSLQPCFFFHETQM